MADRETCIEALANVLKQMDNHKSEQVTRQFKTLKQVADTLFPYVIIEDDGKEEIEPKSNGFAEVSFDVSVWGYVKSRENLSTKINELDKNIKATLWEDWLNPTGVIRTAGVTFIQILPLLQRSGTEMNPFGFFERPFRIFYEAQHIDGL